MKTAEDIANSYAMSRVLKEILAGEIREYGITLLNEIVRRAFAPKPGDESRIRTVSVHDELIAMRRELEDQAK